MGKTVTGKTKREKRRAKQMRQKRGTGREIRATPAGARPGVGAPLASPHSPSQLSPCLRDPIVSGSEPPQVTVPITLKRAGRLPPAPH